MSGFSSSGKRLYDLITRIIYDLDVKQSCYLATTTNINLSGLSQIIDGESTPNGKRILVKDQDNPVENGIYDSSSTAWKRSIDANDNDKVSKGMYCYIEYGEINQDTSWYLSTFGNVILTETELVFNQYNSGGANVIGGNGLVKTGSIIDVGQNPDGSIIVNDDNIQVGILATDAQHGNRGGGNIHALATTISHGFMSSSDKSKLDGIAGSNLRQLIYFIDDGPAEGFLSGAYSEITPIGSLFPTTQVWYESTAKTKKIVERTIEWDGVLIISDVWKLYNTDGSTVLKTITDVISYSGMMESSRVRTIS